MIDQLSPYSMSYILTYNGDVYKYDTSEYENGNYKAIKVISNIKQIVLYKKRSNNDSKGGCDYIIGIDNNNSKYILNSVCV